MPEHVGILICGSTDAQVEHARWALLALGADCHIESRPIEDAILEWPLAGFTVVVIVDIGTSQSTQEFLAQCERTAHSPFVMCVGRKTGVEVAGLLESGADDYVPYDALQDLGPTKIRVLLRRTGLRAESGNGVSFGGATSWPDAGASDDAAAEVYSVASGTGYAHPLRRAS